MVGGRLFPTLWFHLPRVHMTCDRWRDIHSERKGDEIDRHDGEWGVFDVEGDNLDRSLAYTAMKHVTSAGVCRE